MNFLWAPTCQRKVGRPNGVRLFLDGVTLVKTLHVQTKMLEKRCIGRVVLKDRMNAARDLQEDSMSAIAVGTQKLKRRDQTGVSRVKGLRMQPHDHRKRQLSAAREPLFHQR